MLDDSKTSGVVPVLGPAHSVYLDSFYLDQYEVTVEQYAKFLQASQWKEPQDWKNIRKLLDPKFPVVNVSWVDGRLLLPLGRKTASHRSRVGKSRQRD